MDRVKGKVAIITGVARGLGKAQAQLLAKEGAKVVGTDIDGTQGKNVLEEIRDQSGRAIFVKHDVTSDENWREVMDKTLSEFGRLDVLVNNAGVAVRKAIEDISLEEWRWVMSVNLDGVFLGTKHAIRLMKKTGGGSIINISSVGGIVALLDTSPYIASKGAVRLFTKAAALECSKSAHDYNIRVNSIHPGFVLTQIVEQAIQAEVEGTGRTYEEAKKSREDLTPIGQFGDPEDIAYGVLYLASDESKFMTGSELIIDGGYTAR